MSADRPGRGAKDEKIGDLDGGNAPCRRIVRDLERPFDLISPRRRRQFVPRPLGKGTHLTPRLLQAEGFDPETERHLASEGQMRQPDQIVVLDEDAVEVRLPSRRQPRRGGDRRTVLGRRIERDDDPLDPSGHETFPIWLRISATAFAVNSSSRAATFLWVVLVGTPVISSKPWSIVSIGMTRN